MLGEGLEPSQDYSHRILNPARLPIPPSEPVLAAAVVRSASGAEGNRTPDLLNAIQALSQLSYSPNPNILCFCGEAKSPKATELQPRYFGTTRVFNQRQLSAGLTGLEPATSGVTDRHSNQLSYSPIPRMLLRVLPFEQSGRPDSNWRPSRWQRDALPTELRPHYDLFPCL
jgi:hypothetical protein